MKVLLALLAITVCAVFAQEEARYDNYRVHRIVPHNDAELSILRDLENKKMFSFWMSASQIGSPVLIMVAPHQRPLFSDFLTANNLSNKITIPNVQKHFDAEKSKMRMAASRRSGSGMSIDWKSYYSVDEINQWLRDLEKKHNTVKVVTAGKSYEGRDILAIEINNGAKFPGAILEAGIHAREWISPAATSWVVNKILNSPADSIFRKFNYLYIPVANPDGYEYTRNYDRSWRKTRSPHKVDGGLTCYGADPNRNWDYKWMMGGSSTNPCDETYAGPAAFSETETMTISKFYKKVAHRYDIYLAFHSFSQLLMYPWGYTGEDTPMEETWKRIGEEVVGDIKAVHGKTFRVGSIHDVIYPSSGSSIEWYYGTFNSTLTYVFELRDTGKYGFVLPPEQIVPSGEELLPGIRRFLVEYLALKKKSKQ